MRFWSAEFTKRTLAPQRLCVILRDASMRIQNSRLPVCILVLLAVLLSSCREETQTQEPPPPATEEAPGDPNRIVLADPSGATLVLDFTPPRIDVLLLGLETQEFSVPVWIRFQGGDAEEQFRERTGFGPDEEDYWYYEEDAGHFEVGRPLAFADALADAERVYLVLALSEEERIALVFAANSPQRDRIVEALEANSERVQRELAALGLDGNNAAPREIADPLEMDLEEESLLVLYDEYLVLLGKMHDEQVLPVPNEQDIRYLQQIRDFPRLVTSSFRYYEDAYPSAVDEVERMAIDAGFESLEQFTEIGDRVQLGMAAAVLDRSEPGHIRETRAITPAQLAGMEPDRRSYAEVVQAFRETEIAWFTANRDRFSEAVGN